jgi:hypothetical protein
MSLRDTIERASFVVVSTREMMVPMGADEAQVRLEILRSASDPELFRIRFWMAELYRVQSTFPQDGAGKPAHEPSDELILKAWESFAPVHDTIRARDAAAAEAAALDELGRWLEGLAPPAP